MGRGRSRGRAGRTRARGAAARAAGCLAVLWVLAQPAAGAEAASAGEPAPGADGSPGPAAVPEPRPEGGAAGASGEGPVEAGPAAGVGEEAGEGLPFLLRSSRLSVDGAHWRALATGGVKLSYEGIDLDADEVFLDVENKESFARGSVRLMQGKDILSCDSLSFGWETQVGAVSNADLLVGSTGYRVLAEFMEKTGPDTYSAERSSFTTCRCPEGCRRLPWLVEAGDAEVTLGGYARVRRARFRLFDVPVLYLPLAYLPVKLDRESGFLIPQISQSGTNGWGFGVPYFWAIDASHDATFLLEGYTKRGAKPNLEFRYRPSAGTEGTWKGSGFYDMEMEAGRYGVKGRHQQALSDSFYDKINLNAVSDDTYIEDFPWEVGWTADRLLESSGVFGYRRDGFHAAAVVDYSQLVEGVGGQEIAQKAPAVSARMFRRPIAWPWLTVSLDAAGTNYVDENGEDRVRGEVLPEAQVSFQPVPGLNLRGHGGVREVLSWGDMELYDLPWAAVPGFEADRMLHRTLVETGAGMDARFGRPFRWGDLRLFHMVQPAVEYQFVRSVDGELFPVEMDGLDTLERRNWFTYSVRTSLWGTNLGKNRPGRLLAEMRVVQSLALERDPQDIPEDRLLSDVRVELEVYPRPYLSGELAVQVDPYRPALRTLEASVGVWDRRRDYGLILGYLKHDAYAVNPLTRVELVDVYDRDYLFPGIDDTLRAQATVRPFPWLLAVWNSLYLINESGKIENYVSVEYLSQCKCWSAVLNVRQTVRPDDVSFSFLVRLEGLGSY